MRYVEWVERVFDIVMALRADPQTHLIGVPFMDIARELGQEPTAPGFTQTRQAAAIRGAMMELDGLGLVEVRRGTLPFAKVTQNGLQVAAGSFRDLWPSLAEQYVTDDQRTFLGATATLAESRENTCADIDLVSAGKVFESLGWESDAGRARALTKELSNLGLLHDRVAIGSIDSVRVAPTYAGFVVATEAHESKLHVLVRGMLAEGETTTVEFKVQLNLSDRDGKGEFVHDVLGLATTKASGRRRFLVVGIDDKTGDVVKSAEPAITQDRIEDILNAYAVPAPEVRYTTVGCAGGLSAGVLEVYRDPTRIPYRFSRGVGKYQTGDVFVRHGSHVEPPTAAELASLEAEGERARNSAV